MLTRPHTLGRQRTSRRSSNIIREFEKLVGSPGRISYYPLVVREAHGSTIVDTDGNRFLDFNASWTVAGVGYSNPEVVGAVARQLRKTLGLATMSLHPSEEAVEFAKKLVEITPGKFAKSVWFGHSGSDACAAAYKLLPLTTKKERVISFFGGMQGIDLAGIAMAGHHSTAKFRVPNLTTKVPFAYCYRCPYNLEYPSCGIYCASEFIEEHVFKYVNPPEDTSFMIVEPVQSDSGEIVPPPGYFEKLRKTCDRFGIQLVVDEVKEGFGRTGKMFGIENSPNVIPDALALGKSIASGLPLGALVTRRSLLNTGFAVTTLSCNNLSAAAGLATISYIQKHRLPDNAAKMGEYLKRQLENLQSKHELIGDVRGLGLIIGVELVKNRETKEPAKIETAKVVLRAWQLGLIVAFVGADSNVIEITPPLTICQEEVDIAVEIINKSLTDVERGLIPDSAVAKSTGF
jgi:4-aminobutyrate aminotransferase